MTLPQGGWALRTGDEQHFVTAVNGGGLGGPDSGHGVVALHTDATTATEWETFELVILTGGPEIYAPNTTFALKTFSGNYVTAVNSGGVGGPNDASCPIHTDATQIGDWEQYLFNVDYSAAPPTVTIQTWNLNYLTAVNGGGIGGPNDVPVHTDATTTSIWETFSVQIPWETSSVP